MNKVLFTLAVALLAFTAGFVLSSATMQPQSLPIGAAVNASDITDNSGVTVQE